MKMTKKWDPVAKPTHRLNSKTAGQFLATRKLVERISVEAGTYIPEEFLRKIAQTDNRQDQAFWDLRFSTRKTPVPGGN